MLFHGSSCPRKLQYRFARFAISVNPHRHYLIEVSIIHMSKRCLEYPIKYSVHTTCVRFLLNNRTFIVILLRKWHIKIFQIKWQIISNKIDSLSHSIVKKSVVLSCYEFFSVTIMTWSLKIIPKTEKMSAQTFYK